MSKGPTYDETLLDSDLTQSISSGNVHQLSHEWSNIDLFLQSNEASKDCTSATYRPISTANGKWNCTIVIDDSDNEFDDFLAHEDFQSFTNSLSVLRSDQQIVNKGNSSGTNQCQIFDQIDSDCSIVQQNRKSKTDPAVSSPIKTTPVSRKVGHRASTEVTMAQLVAKSRLRDFNMSSGWSRSSLNVTKTPQRSCIASSQKLFQSSDQQAVSPIEANSRLELTSDARYAS